jgi:predicted membrane-bound spermidine synthase
VKAPAAYGILLVVFLAGAGTLVVELAAVRLLAPWYGTSSGVWTNVIGVILLALALGYLAGARLCLCADPLRALGACLLLSAAATAWLPAGAGPVAGWFLPAGLRLDEAATLLTWGSLASALVLFFPPAALLGCVGPLAVEALQRRQGGHAGVHGGRVLAAGTLGSLAGTFLTTHVGLPVLGLTRTFLATAAGLAVCGLALCLRPRAAGGARLLALVAGAAVVAALAGSRLVRRPPAGGAVLVEARETAYQSVRVVATPDASGPTRRLEVNEGFDSFQSVWQPEAGLLPPGYYYDQFALPAAWSGVATGGPPWRVLVLGLGAGTAWRVLEGALPVPIDATGVEIDPGVVRLARRHLGLPPEGTAGRRVLSGWDARAALCVLPGPYDQVVLDSYANQVEIPAHLSSVEFFRQVRVRLAAGGWVSANVGGFGLQDPVVAAVGRTLAAAFERRALAVAVPFSRNVVIFARRDAEPPEPGSEAFAAPLARAAGTFAIPGTWRWFEPGVGPPLTDDKNPIDALERRSIREAPEALAGA